MLGQIICIRRDIGTIILLKGVKTDNVSIEKFNRDTIKSLNNNLIVQMLSCILDNVDFVDIEEDKTLELTAKSNEEDKSSRGDYMAELFTETLCFATNVYEEYDKQIKSIMSIML